MFLLFVFGLVYLVVAWHELGHYLVARYYGIGIQEYAIGFGPKLFETRRGPTRFTFRMLPFGGYVDPADWSDVEEPKYLNKLHPEERAMVKDQTMWASNKPWRQQVAMTFAGPAFNFALAFAILLVVGLGAEASVLDIIRGAADSEARQRVVGVVLSEPAGRFHFLDVLPLAMQTGWAEFLRVFAVLNLALGLLNLFPMLPLDGGRIVWISVFAYKYGHLEGDCLLDARRRSMTLMGILSLIGIIVFIGAQFML